MNSGIRYKTEMIKYNYEHITNNVKKRTINTYIIVIH